MIVTCPRCLTKFNLADENLGSNVEIKLRCSRCGEEFVLAPQEDTGDLNGMNYLLPDCEKESCDSLDSETGAGEDVKGDLSDGEKITQVEIEPHIKPELDSEPGSVSDGSRKHTSILFFFCFLILGLALWVGYSFWQHFSVEFETHLQLHEVSNQRLRLPSERLVVVLRGKVVNPSPNMVTNLKIKGVLVDGSGQVVAEMMTSGGVVFSDEELDHLDDGKLAILEESAVNLLPNGGELPFMIAFYDYPAGASKCYVEISSFKVKKAPVR